MGSVPYKDAAKQLEAVRRWRAKNPDYMHDYLMRWRQSVREKLRARLGGKCVRCGTVNRLEFDHVDPSTKLFHIANGINQWKGWARLIEEVDKCQLLCHSCHVRKTLRS